MSAEPNRPLTTGDEVWSDAGSHAELQIGSAQARLGENTSVAILNLDDQIGQFQLAQGTLNLRVRRIEGDQFYEIDTPTLAFSVRRDGDYRVDVDPSGNTTVIQVRSGEGDAWGEGTAYTIDAGQQYTFAQGFQNVQYDPLPAPDPFDQWCFDRDRFEGQAMAARYVSPDVIGYADLDQYGTWRDVQGYGNVWVPTRVDPDWAPYHYGRWAWVEPWGWTWIDDQPWGFAPFHYGRWAYLSSRWCWVPGPVAVRAVYAPALVAFVGGNGFSLSIGGGPVTGVAWFPLGVGDVYRPPYEVSRTYFTNVNITNTVINRTYVTQIYNNPRAEVRYRNRGVASAVTAVPTNVFASGERVERHLVRVPRDIADRQPVTPVAAIAPTRAAVIAAGAAAGAAVASHRPPREVLNRQVVARTQPPPPKPSFEATSRMLASQPGRPLAPQEMQRLRSERASNQRTAEAPRVRVVSPNVTPRPPERGMAKGGPGATPPTAGPPGAPTAQEERARARRPGEQAGQAPQPPAAAQERMREQQQRRQAQGAPTPPAAKGAPTPQEERAAKAGRPAPGERVPQPPAQAQERMRGGPGGPAAQQERSQQQRAQQEQAQRAQQQREAQQRAQQQRSQQEQAQGAQQERAQQRAEQQRAAQERAQQKRAQQEQAQRAQQERAQQRAEQQRAAQERAQQQRAQQEQAQRAQQERAQQRAEQQRAAQERVQQQRAQQEQAQRAQQERAQQQRAQQQQAAQERAQQQRARQERAQAQRAQQEQAQRGQQERAQQQQAQRAQQEAAAQQRAQQQATQERAQQERQRAQEKEKEKEKERPPQQ